MMYETNAQGEVVKGNKDDLIAKAYKGAQVRVVMPTWGTGGFAMDLGDVRELDTSGDSVMCGQTLKHVTKQSWDTFPHLPLWRFFVICTSGEYHELTYDIGRAKKGRDNIQKTGIQWFVKNTPCNEKVVTNENLVNVNPMNLEDLRRAVLTGYDIRIKTGSGDKTKSVLQNSVEITNGRDVAGQNIWQMVTQFVGKHVEFSDNLKWQFTISSTEGTLDKSLWVVGEHTPAGLDTEDLFGDWYVDPCWQHVYTNDEHGNEVDGSLEFLKVAVDAGHRVKVVIGNLSMEASNVQISTVHVRAQFLDRLTKESPKYFTNEAKYIWQMVHTTGKVLTRKFYVGSTTIDRTNEEMTTIRWFIDSRSWKKVLSTDSTGAITFGSKAELRKAILKGAAVRVAIQVCTLTRATPRSRYRRVCEWMYMNADNVELGPNEEVAAQLTRRVSTKQVNTQESDIKATPSWEFTIVTTKSIIHYAKMRVGEHINDGQVLAYSLVSWFVSP